MLLPQFAYANRRPFGKISLATPSLITPPNPCGWFDQPQTWKTGLIPRSMAVLKSLTAQGVIFWDIEGAGLDHYLGCPEQADFAIDNLFKPYRSAGFKVGCTLRCDEWNPESGKLERSPNPYQTLLRKATYANYRWGCKIFYVDSNMYDWRASGELLSPLIFAALRKQLWWSLWIPEHEKTPGSNLEQPNTFWGALDYWRQSAPYLSLADGEMGTPAKVREFVPSAFSVINVTSSRQAIIDKSDVLRMALAAKDVAMIDVMNKNECIEPLIEIMRPV